MQNNFEEVNLHSIHPKEHYQNIRLFFEPGYGVLTTNQFENDRSYWEIKYSKECATEDGFLLTYSDDSYGGDPVTLVFPSLGDVVFYFRYHLIKQWDVIENLDGASEEELSHYKISMKAQELERQVESFIHEAKSSEELIDSLNGLCSSTFKYIDGIRSIQDYLTEIFIDDPIEETNLEGIFWQEDGKWKCNQWDKFQDWVNNYDNFERDGGVK